jgi:poly(A) polymerase
MGRDRRDDREPVAAAGVGLVRMPDGWRRPGLGLIADALDAKAGAVRLVGGAVRDSLAGLAVQDVDLATTLTPTEVIRRLAAAKVKSVPTGIAHGTITAVLEAGPVEITTLRRDVATDGRRATVAFSDDWKEDAARRDFTINALYADLITGEVYDYFGGLDDLRAGVVRFIGDPLTRIAEDHLRILRFFRFQARFGRAAPDAAALAACAARANDLMALSRERIADELFKLLGLPDPVNVVQMMLDHGILAPVLPEITQSEGLAHVVRREVEEAMPPGPARRFASLIPADPIVAKDIAARLKLSNRLRKRLEVLAKRTSDDARNPRALAYWLGVEDAIDRILLGDGDLAPLNGWTPPSFSASGADIVARGTRPGPAVAALLKAVEQEWVNADFPPRARVEAMLDRSVREWGDKER